MSKSGKKSWTRLLIPGFIFQSVTVGGGYGTGAEIAQYFGVNGLAGGMLGLIVTMIIWALICAVAFEVARLYKTYDYGSLMRRLLGPSAPVYDILYYVMMFIVLGVLYSTASSMFTALTGLSGWIGIAILFIGVIVLSMRSTAVVEKVLAIWSYVLYAVYIVFVILTIAKFHTQIGQCFSEGLQGGFSFISNGAQYAFYNLVVVPLILYTVRDCDTRKESIVSGILAGVLGVIPGFLLLLAMSSDMATVQAVVAGEIEGTPVSVIFDNLDMTWFYVIFEIVLFGTLIETGTGFVKACTDRIEVAYVRKRGVENAPKWMHPVLCVAVVIVGVLISLFGLFNLIVQGYGTACWGFLVYFAIPVVIGGIRMIVKANGKPVDEEGIVAGAELFKEEEVA